ncbi:MAG: serine protease [Candidatus Limnocylindrales bacterium]
MALIPPAFLDAVVAIGFPREDEKTQWAASGFLYGQFFEKIDEGTSRYRTYLVTNRHVLENERTVVLRFNPEADEPAREYRADLVDTSGQAVWAPHPDGRIDVAVLTVSVEYFRNQGVRTFFFQDDRHVLFRDQCIAKGLTEGDGVFVLGFPLGQVGAPRNFVIARQGIIARIRDWLAGAATEFLIDASVFPGNSGGPVINRPEAIAITGTSPINSAYLLGVVSGFLPYLDVAVSAQTRRPRVTFEENSGLASVIPADFIRETIDAYATAHPLLPPPPGGTVTEAPLDTPGT